MRKWNEFEQFNFLFSYDGIKRGGKTRVWPQKNELPLCPPVIKRKQMPMPVANAVMVLSRKLLCGKERKRMDRYAPIL